MSDLVPELRPDKTGKMVTRWVKPSASTAAKKLPAPAQLTARDIPSLHRQAMKALGLRNNRAMPQLINAVAFMCHEAPELLERVVRDCETTAYRSYWEMVFNLRPVAPAKYTLPGSVSKREIIEALEEIRRPLAIMPLVMKFSEAEFGEGDMASIAFRNLETAVGIKTQRMRLTEDELRAYTALAYAKDIHRNPGRVTAVHFDQDEINFYAANMDRIEPLLPHLIQRRDSSIAFIRELWENPSSSLNEGVL